MLFAQNSSIRVGVDLDQGGSITFLAPSDHAERNVVNSFDRGRQVQLSFYSGPVPFQPPGAVLSPAWQGLGWNPIQTGDAFGNRSKVLEARSDGHSIYVKCIPMQWPLKNVPGECIFEVWLTLDGDAVRARCRLTNDRSDLTQYPARAQELPAVYVNAPYHHLITYTGDRPFHDDSCTEIHNRLDKENRWATWLATENWAAQLDDQNWGLGVWNPSTARISGGFFSEPGEGGPSDPPTGYIAPNRTEILDHDIAYEFSYTLILGSLDQIRGYVYKHASHRLPSWRFQSSREGWSYENSADSGWPIRGGLSLSARTSPAILVSPEFAIASTSLLQVTVDADTPVTLTWRSGETQFKTATAVPTGGRRQLFEIDPGDGLVTQLKLTVSLGPKPANIHSVLISRQRTG